MLELSGVCTCNQCWNIFSKEHFICKVLGGRWFAIIFCSSYVTASENLWSCFSVCMQKCHSIQGSKLPRLSRAWWCAWRDTGWTEGWIGWKGGQHNADSISALGLGISTEPPVFLEILRQPPWPWWTPCAWRISPLAVRRIPSCKGTMLPYRRRGRLRQKASVWSVKCQFVKSWHSCKIMALQKSSPTKGLIGL